MIRWWCHAVVFCALVGSGVEAESQATDSIAPGIMFKRDEFTGSTSLWTETQMMKLVAPVQLTELAHDWIRIGFQRNTERGKPASIGIVIEYRGSGWMFIAEGQSLILIVDGETKTFRGAGSGNGREVISSGVMEFAYYGTSVAQLRQIAAAKSVRLKVVGERLSFEGNLTDENRDLLHRFLEEAAKRMAP